ncbi:MAG: hypothetical protein J6S19_04270, partial [Lentisphaeria bacterium]|nr:hypothetical protein [Lentisphaeria bacterium]
HNAPGCQVCTVQSGWYLKQKKNAAKRLTVCSVPFLWIRPVPNTVRLLRTAMFPISVYRENRNNIVIIF